MTCGVDEVTLHLAGFDLEHRTLRCRRLLYGDHGHTLTDRAGRSAAALDLRERAGQLGHADAYVLTEPITAHRACRPSSTRYIESLVNTGMGDGFGSVLVTAAHPEPARELR